MTTLDKMPPLVLDKLKSLLHSLQRAKKTYEQMAFLLKNNTLRQTIIGLAQESRQYATELGSYVHALGIDAEIQATKIEIHNDLDAEINEWIFREEEKDILHWCTKSEKSILRVYRDILNEPYLNEGVRKMMRYQLNGMMHSFSQMKLLYVSLRSV